MSRQLYPGTHGRERPDATALVRASTGDAVTWRQLDERSNKVAHALRGLGLRRGDHLAVVMENDLRYFELVWAALRSGLYYTPVSSLLTSAEAGEVLRACGTSVLVASSRCLELAEGAAAALDAPAPMIVLESHGSTGNPRPAKSGAWLRYEDLLDPMPSTPLPDESEGAPLWFSSGTSGRPKGVLRPLPETLPGLGDAVVLHYVEQFGLGEDTVMICLGPLHHAAPIGFSTAVLRVGGTVVLTERFDAADTIRWIEQYRVTFGHFVPTMFVRLLKLPEGVRSAFDPSSLRTVIHGAAPCPVKVKRDMIDWWGPIFQEYYGGTEGVGSTVITSEEWLEHPGSVGRASRGVIHIADEAGTELSVGETGMVWFENPDAVTAYRNDAEETASITHPEGWQTLGDVGHLDDDGYLFLTDRWTHKIVTGGVNVFPREVEDVLIAHPAVLDVAVIGVPHDEMGEEVRAVVQPIDWEDVGDDLVGELLAWCRERLARHKCPRGIDFDRELPRQENGKLYKRMLRDRYWQARESNIV